MYHWNRVANIWKHPIKPNIVRQTIWLETRLGGLGNAVGLIHTHLTYCYEYMTTLLFVKYLTNNNCLSVVYGPVSMRCFNDSLLCVKCSKNCQ